MRILLVVACLASGAGVAAYVLAWMLIPSDVPSADASSGSAPTRAAPGSPPSCAATSIARRALTDRRGFGLIAAYVPVLVLVLVIASALGASWVWSLTWPAFIDAACLTLIWRNAPEEDRAVLVWIAGPVLSIGDARGRSRVQVAIWAFVGLALLIGGLVLLLGHRTAASLWPIGGVILVLAGVVVVFGPWWLRVARDLVVERQARARAEERADMASRVHDSVLQTLALIQRRSDQPADVLRLARAQERELRSWLFEGQAPGTAGEEATLAAGIQNIQNDVESTHGIKVEVVTVGDCVLDENLRALLAAGREATVNAAKWSKAASVSIFAECGDETVLLFVRDRGDGFDPRAVPSDRRGVSESIKTRVERHGGSAEIRSAPGDGTEVILEMPQARATARRKAPST